MGGRPSCFALLTTWLLAILMVAVIDIYGIAGLLPASILLLVGQGTRREHDRLCAQRIFQSQKWKSFFATYYLLVLGPIVLYAAINHIYLSRLPIAIFVLLLGFPVILAALVNDLSTCRKQQGSN